MDKRDYEPDQAKISGILAILGRQIAEDRHAFRNVPVSEIGDYFEEPVANELMEMAAADVIELKDGRSFEADLERDYLSNARECFEKWSETGFDMEEYLENPEKTSVSFEHEENELFDGSWKPADVGKLCAALYPFGKATEENQIFDDPEDVVMKIEHIDNYIYEGEDSLESEVNMLNWIGYLQRAGSDEDNQPFFHPVDEIRDEINTIVDFVDEHYEGDPAKMAYGGGTADVYELAGKGVKLVEEPGKENQL